jgi:hypothetical protein
MSDEKGLLIRALRLIDIDDNTNVPTVLYYGPGSSPLIGTAALTAAAQSRELLNEDFKVDLGNINQRLRQPAKNSKPHPAGESRQRDLHPISFTSFS